MGKKLNFVRLEGVSIYEQLQVEEALLRVGEGNWCIINTGSDRAVVMGISAVAHEVVDLEKAKGIPLIRRFSGGGTVLVDQDTVFFTLIFNGSDCPKTHTEVMAWVHSLLIPVFSPQILELQDHDFAIQDKKVGGNAQCFANKRVLQHISFLWSWDTMDLLLLPKNQPSYRRKRDHALFCDKLSRYFPTKELFIESLIREIAREFICENASFERIAQVAVQPHRKVLKVL